MLYSWLAVPYCLHILVYQILNKKWFIVPSGLRWKARLKMFVLSIHVQVT